MSLKTTDDPDVLVDRTGGGRLMLVGLPLLFAGIFMLLSTLHLVRYIWRGSDVPSLWSGTAIAAAGAAITFGRKGVILNRRAGTVVKWWGLLVPMYKNERSLADFQQVRLTSEVRQSKNGTYTVYPVRLAGEGKPLEVEEPQDFLKARALAEEIAKFLHLPLDEAVGGAEVVRDADHLDESLRQQAHRTGASEAMPEPPPRMASCCEVDGAQVTLTLPRAGLQAAQIASLVAIGVFELALLFGFVLPYIRELPPVLPVIIVGMALFAILPTIAIIGPLKRTKVTASPEMLRVEQKGLLSSKVTEIPADEIEEFVLPQPDAAAATPAMGLTLSVTRRPGLTARSDKKMVEFGGNLSPEEQQWVHAVIIKVLST